MAPKVEIVAATTAHARQLALRMRPEDVDEVRASGGFTPVEALLHSLERSDQAWTLLFDGEVAAMYGTAPGQDGITYPWLLTGVLVNRHPKAFLRQCRHELRLLLERHPVLFQMVDARNGRSLQWLSWLGFEVGEAEPFGREGRLFHPVLLRRDIEHV